MRPCALCRLTPFLGMSRVLCLALCPWPSPLSWGPEVSPGSAGEGVPTLSSQCSTVLYPRPAAAPALWHVKIVAASNFVSFLFLSVYLGDGFPQRLNVFAVFYMPSFFFFLVTVIAKKLCIKKKLVLFILSGCAGHSLRPMGFSSCKGSAELPWGTWDLSSPTRDQTMSPALWILNHWTTIEVPRNSAVLTCISSFDPSIFKEQIVPSNY